MEHITRVNIKTRMGIVTESKKDLFFDSEMGFNPREMREELNEMRETIIESPMDVDYKMELIDKFDKLMKLLK